jgi:hypothetical protein
MPCQYLKSQYGHLQKTSFANRQPDPAFQALETLFLPLTFAKPTPSSLNRSSG